MAKKKAAPKKTPSLEADLKNIHMPFDLYTAFSSVINEATKKDFIYNEMILSVQPTIIFKSKAEKILISVTKENLVIKQFSEDEKLKVIYVVKPSERNFKLY